MSDIQAPRGDFLQVAVLTGFLGSGKTTLLNRLLRQPAMDETAVIVNELGEIGIDHMLIESSAENVHLLSSGCLCCAVRGDLVRTLHELFLKRAKGEVPAFRRVIIETTGLADPAPILHTLMLDPLIAAHFRLNAVITTVDSFNGWRTLDMHSEAVKQAAVADRLVLTKIDIASASLTERLVARLEQLNPAAPILFAVNGAIEPDALFDTTVFDSTTKSAEARAWLAAEAYGVTKRKNHHRGRSLQADRDPGRHDSRIRAFCLTYAQPFEWERVATWLDHLTACRGDNLLRVKGLLNVTGVEQPVVIHGVQHLLHPPARLPSWPDADRRSQIVFITHDLDRGLIERSLLNAMPWGIEPTRSAIA